MNVRLKRNVVTRAALVAGVERTALAAGVQLRVLQRLPHTAAFAAYMAALGDGDGAADEEGSDGSGDIEGSVDVVAGSEGVAKGSGGAASVAPAASAAPWVLVGPDKYCPPRDHPHLRSSLIVLYDIL